MSEDRTILLIGSGPIQIGQAAEFDYSGAQACRALQEEGARVVLVNSNPATIMTDPETADRVYIEPITPEAIAEVIRIEEPDGVIAGLGGQTGLNVTAELAEEGILEEHDVEVMGTPLDTIYATEDRDLFRQRMEGLGQPVPKSTTISLDEGESVTDFDEEAFRGRVQEAVDAVGGLPVIARTTYTLGGSGSGVVDEFEELVERVRKGLRLSRNSEVLVTESIAGWVELEYEVMRDADDSCIIICNMENIDPMGIHTGESTVVTPSQVIPDDGHQEMRDAALEVIRDLGIQGGCNIQFAWHDDGTPGGEYRVVEVNPRVSRSSALASKATGYPIARVTAKVALGKRLHEIDNEITGETTAAFEPAIDYVVTKVPRWPIDKFDDVDFELGTAMKSTGEAMSIGRTFEESMVKALRSSEYDPAVDFDEVADDELESGYLERPSPDRPYAMFEAFDRGYDVDDVIDLTGIHRWYVERFEKIAAGTAAAAEGDFTEAAMVGRTDAEIAATATAGGVDASVGDVETAVPDRTYKQVDTCAGEFEASTPYYYSARLPEFLRGADTAGAANEVRVDPDVESVVVVGGGPIRIGQGVEFDYCAVHAVRALRELGIDAHVINNNPETVSTDYDTSDGLFFEPISAEEVADVIETTGADGVMVQFGGQTSVNVGEPLESEIERRGLDCEIMGTSVEAMDLAEDRDRFNVLMDDLGVAQPDGGTATSEAEALELAHGIGYPVLVRPSYVLGGRAMRVVEDDAELEEYIEEAVRVSPDKPILVDQFLDDAVELDVDAVADGEDVLLGGVMEHVESAGVHSGDSAGGEPALLADGPVRLEGDGRPHRQARREGDDRRPDARRPRRRRADPRTPQREGGRPPVRPSAGLGPASGAGDEVDRRSDGHGDLLRQGVRQGAGLDREAHPRVRHRRRRPLGGGVPRPRHRGGRGARRRVRGPLRAERSDGPDRGREARRPRPHRLAPARPAGGRRRGGDHLLLDARLRDGGAGGARPRRRRPRRDGGLRPPEARRAVGRRGVVGARLGVSSAPSTFSGASTRTRVR